MIRVVVDDLAFLPVDAVLRPANETLDPTTPLVARLDRCAGQEFTHARRVQAPLEVGAAVVTRGGELAAPFVVHVVIRSAEQRVARDTVRRGLLSAWQRAADWQLSRVATPLVGAEVGGLSVEEAAAVMAETYREHAGSGACPTDLSIVVEHDRDRAVVEAILGRPPA
ncbi:MAG: macro domain-containing protein [Gemmatimonadales bacterium]